MLCGKKLTRALTVHPAVAIRDNPAVQSIKLEEQL